MTELTDKLIEVKNMLKKEYLNGKIDRTDWVSYDTYCQIIINGVKHDSE